MKRSHLGPQRT